MKKTYFLAINSRTNENCNFVEQISIVCRKTE